MRPRLVLVALAAAAVAVVACSTGGTGASASQGEGVELTIFGAASLAKVLDQARAAYEAANPGTVLTISTDSSSAGMNGSARVPASFCSRSSTSAT